MMAEFSHSYNRDDEDLYTLPGNDPLGVLRSTRRVIEQGELVWINREQVDLLAEQWHQAIEENLFPDLSVWYGSYCFHDGGLRTVNWLLVLDALNFCFWAEKERPRWSIEYKGETLNGYWAEAAALTRAVEEGIPLWDADYLSTMSAETLAAIFRGTSVIPLFEERVRNIREVGSVLREKYQGQFAYAIEQAQGSAVQLVQTLIQDFPSFCDRAGYRNHEVRFYKRAQICIADLHAAFAGKGWGAFTDLHHLTIFADYKLPQVLRHYAVIEYHPLLAERIDRQELLDPGSEEEVEIRATTIWACELLRRALLQYGYALSAVEIDQKLWYLGQQLTDMRPYHRTRTIYY